jgi:hypothetical protein
MPQLTYCLVGSASVPQRAPLLTPAVTSAFQIVLSPATPRFVKIWITPFDASVPYSVVAAAPLMTSTRSMSSGAMSWSGEMKPRPPQPARVGSFAMRTPST